MSEFFALHDLVELQRGTTYKSEFIGQEGPVLLGLGAIERNGGFRSDSLRMYGGGSPDRLLVRPGELFLSLKDVTQTADLLGAVARVPVEAGAGRLTQDTVRLDIRSNLVSTSYLYWALRAPQYRAYCRSHATGTTNLGLSRDDFFAYSIPKPDRMRLVLVELLEALDDKIAANHRLAGTADELAATIFAASARDVPQVAMSAVLTPVLGGTPARSNASLWSGTHLWASAKDITNAPHGVVLDTEEKVTDRAVELTKTNPLPRGSVILTARGTVGAVARLGEPAALNQSCYGFTPDRLTRGLLYFSVLLAATRAKAIAHGSVFDTITVKSFNHLVIPKFDEESAAKLESRLAGLLDLVEQSMRESVTLAATRDALLPHLMSGKLRVKDAEKIVSDRT